MSIFKTMAVRSLEEATGQAVRGDNPPRDPPAVCRDLVLDLYNANYFHRLGCAAGGAP